MHILAHGIDIVDIDRLGQVLDNHQSHFLDRVFSPDEQAYCFANPKRCNEHLAGRFAAKEAILKAIGTGWSRGIAWTEVEVVRTPSGRPTVRLSGRAAEEAAAAGITQWQLSISHIKTHAIASAIALGAPRKP